MRNSLNQKSREVSGPVSAGMPRQQVDGTAEAVGSLTPELVVALCGPIGSPLHAATVQIMSALSEFGYLAEKIRLSELIRLNANEVGVNIPTVTKFAEITALIDAGDKLREAHGPDVLAKLAIAKIGADRRKKFGNFEDKAGEQDTPEGQKIKNQRICHVIDSVKNSAELDLLRLIYGDALFSIGVFSPLEIRRRNLQDAATLDNDDIKRLIDTDSGEEFSHGQSVRDTFPRCDFFVRIDFPIVGPTEPQAIGQLAEKFRRFFGLIFRAAVVTPTQDETAMYAAASAGRNSACLSRQVGAAVTSKAGELLAIGWNDVPQSGGGLYGKPQLDMGRFGISIGYDQRCFAQPGSKCHNEMEKRSIANRVVAHLAKEGLLAKDKIEASVDAIISDTSVKDLIEFSRAVHAEMHAILGASRVAGDRILGGRIFVTTYPCHSCARHIVAAGIHEVVYIEPYRKSLATRLHNDAITEADTDGSKVRLKQFDGVAPRRFIDLFEAGPRKKDGVLKLKGRYEALPSTHVSLRAIPRLEEVVVAEVRGKHLRLPELVENGGSDGKDDSPKQAA